MFNPIKFLKISNNLIKWVGNSLTRISIAVLSLIGFITSIISFTQLFSGNRQIFIIVLITVSLFAWLTILGRLAYISFSKIDKKVKRRHKHIYKFEDHLIAKQWFIILATLTIITTTSCAVASYCKDQELRNKTIILLTHFNGPSPENYLVNEKLYRQLSESLAGYPEVIIQTIEISVKENEQEGSDYARIIGKRYRADMVLWGYYAITDSNALITIHFENMNDQIPAPLSASSSTDIQVTKELLDNFTIQQTLSDQMTALAYFVTGIAYFQSNKYEDALRLFNSALSSQDWAENLLNRAYIYDYRASYYIDTYNFKSATSDLDTAIELNPNNPVFYTHKGQYLTSLGKYDEALSSINHAIKLDRSYYQAYNERASLYIAQDKFHEAISDIDTMIRLDPKNPDSYSTRAWLYNSMEQKNKAINDRNKVIWLDPLNWHSYHDRARTYINFGEYQRAIRDLNIVVLFNPSSRAYNDRAVAYMSLNNYKKACKDLEVLKRESKKNDISLLSNLAQCYSGLEETEKEIAAYSDVIRIFEDPSSREGISLWEKSLETIIYNNRGVAYGKISNYEAALRDFDKSATIDPDKAITYINRGSIYADLNRVDEALLDLTKAKTLTTDPQELLYINAILAKLNKSP